MNQPSPAPTAPSPISRRYAWYALLVLTFINCINYVDRFVLPAVEKQLQAPVEQGGLGIDDAQFGFLGTVFFLVYLLSPVTGYLGDRIQRRKIIAVGIFLWSLATVLSAYVKNYEQLVIARALTGIGELAYGIVAPAFLSDLFDRKSRSRTLSVFYLALPVGTAAGYTLGGYIAQHYGWREAFLIGGAPGLVLAVLAWCLKEPARGASDAGADPHGGHGAKVDRSALAELFRNRALLVNIAALTVMTFAIGGLSYWMPAYIRRVHGYPTDVAAQYIGIMAASAGIVGTLLGGIVADRAARRFASAHFVLPGCLFLVAAVLLFFALRAQDKNAFWALSWVTVCLLFANSGPLNAAIVNSTMPAVRSTAFALTIFTIHMLGDGISPWLIGKLSTVFSTDQAEGLRAAFLITPPLVAAAGVLLLVFRKRLPEAVAAVEGRLQGAPAL